MMTHRTWNMKLETLNFSPDYPIPDHPSRMSNYPISTNFPIRSSKKLANFYSKLIPYITQNVPQVSCFQAVKPAGGCEDRRRGMIRT